MLSIDRTQYYEAVEALMSRLETTPNPSPEDWVLVNLIMDSALYWGDLTEVDMPPYYGGTQEQWDDLSTRASDLCLRWETDTLGDDR